MRAKKRNDILFQLRCNRCVLGYYFFVKFRLNALKLNDNLNARQIDTDGTKTSTSSFANKYVQVAIFAQPYVMSHKNNLNDC